MLHSDSTTSTPPPYLVEAAVSTILWSTSLPLKVPLRGDSASTDRNLWRLMMLTASVSLYKGRREPSLKPSIAINTITSIPPDRATLYTPQDWKPPSKVPDVFMAENGANMPLENVTARDWSHIIPKRRHIGVVVPLLIHLLVHRTARPAGGYSVA